VQVFESGNGYFTFEFNFYDNVFSRIKGANTGGDKEKEKEKAARDLETEFKKCGLSRAEFNLSKRKLLREKGEYIPELPTTTKVVRTHFHMLN